MRCTPGGRQLLRGCAAAIALVALSCTPTDEQEEEKTVTGPPSLAITGTSQYDIIRANTPMTIDGNLSDWAGIAAIPTFADDPNNGRGALNNTASVKLAWDSTYLYAAYTITDTEVLAVQTTRDASALYQDDAIELYIDPQGNGGSAPYMATTDYQFLVSARNVLGDLSGNGTGGKTSSFNAANFQAATVVNGTLNGGGADVGYVVELRIKWTDIGVTPAAGHVMQIDPAVDDRDTQNTTTEEFDWANLTIFNNPSGWKEVHLVVDNTPPAAPTNPKLTVVSPTRIDVSWTASTSSDVTGYKIYRSTSGTPTFLTTDATSPFQNTGLTPSITYNYQISAVDAAGNESAKTTLKTARTPSHALSIGLFNLTASPSLLGLGPGGDAVGGIYRAGGVVPSPSSINNLIATAESLDVVLALNLADSRNNWTDLSGSCRNYNATKYETQIRRFEGNATLTDALARRRVVVYLVDEPFHATFCNTLPPSAVNNMGLLVKSIWPGAITMVRGSAKWMVNEGWGGSGPLGPTFWSGVDYGWAQYESRLHVPSHLETPAQFYAREKSQLASANLGMVPGFNILDGGNDDCWNYQNTGSSGRIAGTFTQGGIIQPGQFVSCASGTQGNTRWYTPPAQLQAAIDAIYNDPDAPFFIGWTHVYTNFAPAQSTFAGLEARSDIVSSLDYWISKGATRTQWNGWRTAK